MRRELLWAALGALSALWLLLALAMVERPVVPIVRARRFELLDEAGRVVGHFGVTEGGVELVLGGQAQVSLVTEQGTAAANFLGDDVIVRLLGERQAQLVTAPSADGPPSGADPPAQGLPVHIGDDG